MRKEKAEHSARLPFAASMLIFGTIGLLRRFIDLPSGVIACFRGLLGCVLLLLLQRLGGKKPGLAAIRKSLLPLLISGGMIGFNWMLLFEAYRYTSIAVATLCYYTAPVMLILASPFVFHERLTWRQLVCVGLAACGMVLVSGVLDGGTLPDFTEGQTFDGAEVSVTEHFTQPPKPYTEDTLLSAMENAGKEDIPDEVERKGLGTPATRAAVIEKLVTAGFVERKGKSLIPTKAGINLVTVLPEPLTSPMLTAEWEQKLTEIAKGGADPDTFMDGIRTMVQEIVSTYSCISEDGKKLFAPEKEVIGTCPRCGQPVYEGKKNFACSDRSCGFVLWKNDRFWTSRKKELTKKMAADLLKKGRTNVKGMWSEKKQAAYDAAVILNDTGGKYINFKLEFPKRKVSADGRK